MMKVVVPVALISGAHCLETRKAQHSSSNTQTNGFLSMSSGSHGSDVGHVSFVSQNSRPAIEPTCSDPFIGMGGWEVSKGGLRMHCFYASLEQFGYFCHSQGTDNCLTYNQVYKFNRSTSDEKDCEQPPPTMWLPQVSTFSSGPVVNKCAFGEAIGKKWCQKDSPWFNEGPNKVCEGEFFPAGCEAVSELNHNNQQVNQNYVMYRFKLTSPAADSSTCMLKHDQVYRSRFKCGTGVMSSVKAKDPIRELPMMLFRTTGKCGTESVEKVDANLLVYAAAKEKTWKHTSGKYASTTATTASATTGASATPSSATTSATPAAAASPTATSYSAPAAAASVAAAMSVSSTGAALGTPTAGGITAPYFNFAGATNVNIYLFNQNAEEKI